MALTGDEVFGEVVPGFVTDTDGRLATTVPPAHASTHAPGGSDPLTLPNLGTSFGISGPNPTNTASTANCVYFRGAVIPVATTITGINYMVAAVSAGNVRCAIYDSTGVKVADRTTDATVPAAFQRHDVALDSTYAAPAGFYYLALVFSGVPTTYTDYAFPANYVVGPGAGATAVSITPPTTATTAFPTPIMRTY